MRDQHSRQAARVNEPGPDWVDPSEPDTTGLVSVADEPVPGEAQAAAQTGDTYVPV